ncbi:MAG: hypothetical protein LUE14_01295 [Clostridiales bacterium]|nr:hypothetical protein [Clostridiales bacterium]
MKRKSRICRQMLAFGLAGTLAAGLCISVYAADAPGDNSGGGGSQSSGFTLSAAAVSVADSTVTTRFMWATGMVTARIRCVCAAAMYIILRILSRPARRIP